jgi:leader peptidase (prepilin peptidase)/N-methyltransferase
VQTVASLTRPRWPDLIELLAEINLKAGRKVDVRYFPNYLIGVAVFLFGLVIGSFLNVVIYRVPRRESIILPGSRCPRCGNPIKPYDNIPVASYLILRGRCRNCGIRISPIYPVVELLVAVLYLLLLIKDGLTPVLIADLIFASFIVPLVFIDLEHQLLPNAITYPGLVVMLVLRVIVPSPMIVNSMRRAFELNVWPDWVVSVAGAIVGAAVGGGSLWVVRELYLRIRHIEGMGLGDVKMMLMVGAFLGWELTLLTIFIASLLGSVVGLVLVKIHHSNLKLAIPFGVFLGPAAMIALFVGGKLIAWYSALYK